MKIFISILFFFASLFIALESHSSQRTLVGKALLEYSIFKIDIYEVSYFRLSDGSEELVFEYKTDVKKKYSQMGWAQSLEPVLKQDPQLASKAQWLKDNAVDVVEGDQLAIRVKGDRVTLLKNNQKIASISDSSIAKLAFEPWLGKTPVDQDIKRKLLNI